MALNSRSKGQRAERQVIEILQPVVNKVYASLGIEAPSLERNLMQSMKGGFDVVGLEWMALEIKHQETFHVDTWWQQAKRQSKLDQTPILFYKRNHSKWQVRMNISIQLEKMKVNCPGDISLQSFLFWFELKVKQEAIRK